MTAPLTIGDIFRDATNYKMERGDEKLIDEYTLYGIYNAEADGFLYLMLDQTYKNVNNRYMFTWVDPTEYNLAGAYGVLSVGELDGLYDDEEFSRYMSSYHEGYDVIMVIPITVMGGKVVSIQYSEGFKLSTL